jgi:hypothetical protein
VGVADFLDECDGESRRAHRAISGRSHKRRAVEALRDRFGVSERRAWTVIGIHRSTMRLTPSPITT